ncbi:hypothetical protein [Paenibacillus harenae]|uniref:Uncharacterized protein n=1 Tax=Paenibacillus harenae TaxID=306543 RepID=A0ABT9U6U0_PAEHA|nr:hypothetical protein [Paenibacillus harenae]MDQ0115357.1 hypothetical protein [Paenibacillus harenae]
MRKGLAIGAVVLIVALGSWLYLFRVTEDQVVAHRMLDFDKIEPNTEMVWTEQDDMKTFEYAVRFANKNPGIVDIAAPPYSFKLGGDTYWLYASPEYNVMQFINSKASGTLYTVRKSSADRIRKLLEEADKIGYGVPTPGSMAYPGHELSEPETK